MENKNFFIISFGVLFGALGFWSIFSLPFLVVGQDLANISYPISELGDCASQEECKIFCDQPENYLACSEWAAKNNIISEEELEAVRQEVEQIEKFESGEVSEGPGGCQTPAECDAYCQIPEHAEECFKFGVEHGLISPEEAKQIENQLKEMKGPGECKAKEECDIFCSQPENFEICVNYALKEGALNPDEVEEIVEIMEREKLRKERLVPKEPEVFKIKPKEPKIDKEKTTEILKKEKGPGGCQTLEECREYCGDLSHADECLSFVEKHKLVSSEELKEMRTMTKIMREKGGPGGCKGPEECDKYCSLPENQQECFRFAQEHNLISPEEAEAMRMAGGGPGGCRGQEECDAYCSKPENIKECLMFSVKQGFLTEEEAQKMIEIMRLQEQRSGILKGAPPREMMAPKIPSMFEKGMPKEREGFDFEKGAPQDQQGPSFRMGPSVKPPMDKRPFMDMVLPSDEAPSFDKRQPPMDMMPPMMPPTEMMMPENGMSTSSQRFPSQNYLDTMKRPDIMVGPGGCQTPEECDAYCSKPENMEECMEFQKNFFNN